MLAVLPVSKPLHGTFSTIEPVDSSTPRSRVAVGILSSDHFGFPMQGNGIQPWFGGRHLGFSTSGYVPQYRQEPH